MVSPSGGSLTFTPPLSHLHAFITRQHPQQRMQGSLPVGSKHRLMIPWPVSGTTVLDDYGTEIMAQGVQRRGQDADRSRDSRDHNRINRAGAKRLVKIRLEEAANRLFGIT